MQRRVAYGCDDDGVQSRVTMPLSLTRGRPLCHLVRRESRFLRVELPAEEVDACLKATPSGSPLTGSTGR